MMTPSPRPWMPLLRRRFLLALTSVPRTAPPVVRGEDGRLRIPAPTASLLRRRLLSRREAHDLRQRIDQLSAEVTAWIDDLAGGDR